MDIGGAIASAFDLCLDYVQSVASRIGRQLEPLIGHTPHSGVGAAGIPDAPLPKSLQTGAEEARFHIRRRGPVRRPAPRSPGVLDGDPGELPAAYGYDRVVLLTRDPWGAFAYWEVTPATRADAVRRLGAHGDRARDVLRVYDVASRTLAGHEAASSYDVELPPGVESWYLKLPRPATSYYVEIGLLAPGGQFLAVARSDTITPPRVAPARDDSVSWVTLGNGSDR